MCIVEGCEKEVQVKKYGYCRGHYQRWYLNGSAGTGPIKQYSRGDQIGYRAMHFRIEAARGKATGYECACGCGGMANDWALRPEATEVLWERKPGNTWETPYSLDIENYLPLSRACHRRIDGNSPAQKAGGQ